MMRAWNKLMHQAGGRGDEMDPSMWGMDMDLDPEEAMAVMESMQGRYYYTSEYKLLCVICNFTTLCKLILR